MPEPEPTPGSRDNDVKAAKKRADDPAKEPKAADQKDDDENEE